MAPYAVCLLLAVPAAPDAVSPDPQTLAVTPADAAKARELVKRLGSDAFRDREEATRGLIKMNRLAVTAVEAALATTTDSEVRARCEWLLPKFVAADEKAKYDTFLADTESKFEHDLAGWNDFKVLAGNAKPARELFVEMVKVKENAVLLAGVRSKADLMAKISARRMELYNRTFRTNPDGTRTPPTVAEVATLVLVEAVTDTAADRRYQYATYYAFQQAGPVRDAITGTGEKNEAFRKLVVKWLDTRKDPADLNSALNLVVNLNFKELQPAKFAVRILEVGGNPNAYTKMQAMTYLAKDKDGKAHVPLIRKQLGDVTSVKWFRGGQNAAVEMRVADLALAMLLVIDGQDPAKYGFDLMTPGDASKYNYTNYSFATDEKRKFAITKFGFREAFAKKKK